MISSSKFVVGLLFGLACVRYARDKVTLRLSNFFWNQISLQQSRGATAEIRQRSQQLPHSRLGELTRCCAPVLLGAAVTQSSPARRNTATELSLFCRRDVTLFREGVVVV
jgi:hypothetical protein